VKIQKTDLVDLWKEDRASNLVRLSVSLADGLGIDDLIREIVLEILQKSYRPALAWLVGRIVEAGHALDEALTWDRIKNESIRDFFEDHDDIGAGLLRAISALSEVIEADVDLIKNQSVEDVSADLAVDLLGGGSVRGFFRRGLSLRGRPVSEVVDHRDLPKIIRPTEAAEETAEEVAEVEDVEEPQADPETVEEVEEPEAETTPADRARAALNADTAEAENTDRTSQPATASRRRSRRRVIR